MVAECVHVHGVLFLAVLVVEGAVVASAAGTVLESLDLEAARADTEVASGVVLGWSTLRMPDGWLLYGLEAGGAVVAQRVVIWVELLLWLSCCHGARLYYAMG